MLFKTCQIFSVGWLEGARRQKQKTEVWNVSQTFIHQWCWSHTETQMIDMNVAQNVASSPKSKISFQQHRNARFWCVSICMTLFCGNNGALCFHVYTKKVFRLQRVQRNYMEFQWLGCVFQAPLTNAVVTYRVYILTSYVCVYSVLPWTKYGTAS